MNHLVSLPWPYQSGSCVKTNRIQSKIQQKSSDFIVKNGGVQTRKPRRRSRPCPDLDLLCHTRWCNYISAWGLGNTQSICQMVARSRETRSGCNACALTSFMQVVRPEPQPFEGLDPQVRTENVRAREQLFHCDWQSTTCFTSDISQ